MDYINLKGLHVPALGFGTWQLTDQACYEGVLKALDVGYRHIDTAQIYENEAQVGEALTQSAISRRDIFLTTKLWTTNFSKESVASSFDESLQKLQTDYVDLLLIHWPNPEVSLQETLQAMQTLKETGKVQAIGVSNFPVALMREAVELGFDIVNNQVEYHALLSQKPVLNFIKENDMFLTAYSPLARGALNDHPVLEKIAAKHGKSTSQIALRWLVQQPNVAAIPKASSQEHMRSNFNIFDFVLDDNDLDEIEAINGNNRLINPDFAPKWDKAA